MIRSQDRNHRNRRLPRTLARPTLETPRSPAVLALALCCTLSSCTGMGFTFKSLFRSAHDYDELDRARAQDPRALASSERPKHTPAAFWTQYRGKHGTGVYDEQPLQLSWTDQSPPTLWRSAVGPGYSSMVVAGGLVITMEQRRDHEAVIAFDFEHGNLVWEHAWPARFYHILSKEGPRATPAVQGRSVVALGAEGELRCLDLSTGALRWQHDLLDGGAIDNLSFGLSASPRIRGDLVFAQGADRICAFELATGVLRWTALEETMAYSTPQFGELHGSTHLLVCTKKRILGLEVETGYELWSFPWSYMGDTCTQPLVLSPNRVLASSGYGKGAQLVSLEAEEDGIVPKVVWRSARLKTRYNEPILHDSCAYGLDEGTLTCIDVETGRRLWKEGRYGYGQLLMHRDHLLVVDEDGMVHVLRVSAEESVEVASFEGVPGGMTLNVPALAHGRLFVRNDQELVAFDLRVPPSTLLDPKPR